MPSFWLARMNCRPFKSALPCSPSNGSSKADRYARQAKLVTAMVWVLPHEPSLAWFLVSHSNPFSRAVLRALAWSSLLISWAEAGAVQRFASRNPVPSRTAERIAVSFLKRNGEIQDPLSRRQPGQKRFGRGCYGMLRSDDLNAMGGDPDID